MKYTLLEMVQNIMSSMDSDEVTSITDTPESSQVALELQNIFDLMISNQTIPEKDGLMQLDDISLMNFPGSINYLVLPDSVANMDTLQYNIMQDGDTTDAWSELIYWDPKKFLEFVGKNRTDLGDTVQVTDPSNGVTYWIPKDQGPQHWTSFDDKNIAFDMIDMTVDTIQVLGAKTRCFVKTVPTWTMDDTFVPTIDDNLFPYLIAEAKSTCFVNLKQQANPKVEKQSVEQRVRLQNHRFRTTGAEKSYTNRTPNYGRRNNA